MHTATGTFTSHSTAFPKRARPASRPQITEKANHPALSGAKLGGIIGIVIFGLLLWLSGAPVLALRYITLYLCGIAMCTAGGASIAALWNLGAAEDSTAAARSR